jgi:hypothetical protein
VKKPTGYDMSFTAASLRVNEAVQIIAKAQEQGISDLRELNRKSEIIGGGNSRTTERQFRELRKRLELLTPPQKDLLIQGTLETQRMLCFLSVCKLYGFIRDFTVEVLRDKVLVFDYILTDTDYDIFIKRKQEDHPELEVLTETTRKKIRQVTFKMLEQAGLLEISGSNRIIQTLFPEERLINLLLQDNPEWLKIFFFTDHQIKTLSQL